MNRALDPIVREFDHEEQAADYDRWFRARVHQAIDSSLPRIPRDLATARVQAELDERRKARAGHSTRVTALVADNGHAPNRLGCMKAELKVPDDFDHMGGDVIESLFGVGDR